MNVLLPQQPLRFPHHHNTTAASTNFQSSPNMSARKRKADEELDYQRGSHDGGGSDDMSMSPLASPSIPTRAIARPSKKSRNNEITGRPLTLPRLLETLDAQSLRTVLQTLCERNPQIGCEVVASAPRPSVESALGVLEQYQDKLKAAFPFGGNTGSDYAYNRVKAPLVALVDALTDFVPHYLPPNETQTQTSLLFLDGATKVVHEMPNWQSPAHRYHKENAYEEISRAWAMVINEASKRGGGFQLHNAGWDEKLQKHHEQSGNVMQVAMTSLSNLGWNGGSGGSNDSRDPNSIRNQLFSGTYGNNLPVHVGPW